MKISFKNSNKNWGAVSVLIHWITVLTVISLFIVGLWMTELEYDNYWYHTAPFIHKSVGLSLLILTIFRLVWRIFNKVPESLPTHSKYERILGHLMHMALYILLFSVMFAGYLISTAKGRPVSVFGLFDVPATITLIPKQVDLAGEAHEFLAWTIIIMAALHGFAAIKHHFIDKDETLIRMLGLTKRR